MKNNIKVKYTKLYQIFNIKKFISNFEKVHIKSFVFNASNGGNKSCKILAQTSKKVIFVLNTKSRSKLKLWLTKYIIIDTIIVKIFDIKVDKNKTIQTKITSFKNIKIKEKSIKISISIHLKYKTIKYKIDCKNVIRNITLENPKNFPKINSYLLIGFDKIRKIVFHSISLNKSWLHTNKTPTKPNISIIAIQKSVTTFWSSQIVSFPREIEKIINKKAKTKIKYKNLFLTISLNVFNAMFNILQKIIF